MTTSVTTARELLVGAYIRRSDSAKVRIARLAGTHEHVVDVDGVRQPGTFTRREALNLTRKGFA